MERIAFKMKLFPGKIAVYKQRHDELWPDLRDLLKETGIFDYSIFLDEETNYLFGVMKVEDASLLKDLPEKPVMKKWWASMVELMETNPDNSPVSIPMKEVFYLD
jgi:L-rhamnose mutarotase